MYTVKPQSSRRHY